MCFNVLSIFFFVRYKNCQSNISKNLYTAPPTSNNIISMILTIRILHYATTCHHELQHTLQYKDISKKIIRRITIMVTLIKKK